MSDTAKNNKPSTRKAAVLKRRQHKRKWSTMPDLSDHPYFVKKCEESIKFLEKSFPPGTFIRAPKYANIDSAQPQSEK